MHRSPRLRDRTLITWTGVGGGGLQNGRGVASEALLLQKKKKGGGGNRKSYNLWREGYSKFWGNFHMGACSFSHTEGAEEGLTKGFHPLKKGGGGGFNVS